MFLILLASVVWCAAILPASTTPGFAQASGVSHVSPDSVRFDTLDSLTLRQGVVYRKLHAPSIPWTLDVVSVDLTIPGVRFTTLKAGDRLRGYERTSSMVSRALDRLENETGVQSAGEQRSPAVIAVAVNGDFYRSGGVPVNAQVLDGELLNLPSDRTLLTISEGGRFHIGNVTYKGSVGCQDGELPIVGVNESTGSTGLALYNRFYGSDTGPLSSDPNLNGSADSIPSPSALWSLNALDPWKVNRPVRAVVQNRSPQNVTPLNDSLFAIAHSGNHTGMPCRFQPGDTLTLRHTFEGIEGQEAIISAIGGSRKILDSGVNQGNWPERHPRTAVGFNSDTTVFTFVSVDGRQDSSIGMTLTELADVMAAMGVSHAINLDGGGSTTLVVNGRVMNHPSDKTGERTVANALMVLIPAEERQDVH